VLKSTKLGLLAMVALLLLLQAAAQECAGAISKTLEGSDLVVVVVSEQHPCFGFDSITRVELHQLGCEPAGTQQHVRTLQHCIWHNNQRLQSLTAALASGDSDT
jgi:hypothetical protein